MRIVMMGTGPFAVPTFNMLLESSHEVVALVTRPVPAPTGRRKAQSVPPNPMRDRGEAAGLSIFEPDSINDPQFAETLAELKADLFVVCDYGQILSREALSAAKLGGINLHASLLPKYRGAAPINWALYHGEAQTGVTVIHMTPKLDGGPCLIQSVVDVDAEVDAVQLEQQLAELGVDAVRQSIEQLETWDGQSVLGELQDASLVTKAPRLKKQDGAVDWSRSATQIRNHLRAFKPWPGTYTFWPHPKRGPLRLAIGQVRVVQDTDSKSELEWPGDAVSGQVVCVEKARLVILCGEGCLELLELQPAGKKMLPVQEFLRGYPVQIGDQLTRHA